MDKKTLIELVEFCGGNSSLIDDWRLEVLNREITTIEQLKEYPFKLNYTNIIESYKAPTLMKFIVDYALEYNKVGVGVTLDLSDILFLIDSVEDSVIEVLYSTDNVECEKEKMYKELIDLKLGKIDCKGVQ